MCVCKIHDIITKKEHMMKAEKFQSAQNKIEKSEQRIVYHIIAPKYKEQIEEIKKDYFKPSENALGGQSNGHYFFTNMIAVNHHINDTKEQWKLSNKNIYLVECAVDSHTVKYPTWKLDYEAMQDFLFDMIYDAACEHPIKFENIEIKAENNHMLGLSVNGNFKRIREFTANYHSGIIEQIADHLYKNNTNFCNAYDKLLQDALFGRGDNQELYAIKTLTKPKIINIVPIETQSHDTPNITQSGPSQIDKFRARYSKSK